MSGNPPTPPGKPGGADLAATIRRMKVTVACLEQLEALDKGERIGIVVGLIAAIDDQMSELLAARLGERFKG